MGNDLPRLTDAGLDGTAGGLHKDPRKRVTRAVRTLAQWDHARRPGPIHRGRGGRTPRTHPTPAGAWVTAPEDRGAPIAAETAGANPGRPYPSFPGADSLDHLEGS